jgi:hypothetical protein
MFLFGGYVLTQPAPTATGVMSYRDKFRKTISPDTMK